MIPNAFQIHIVIYTPHRWTVNVLMLKLLLIIITVCNEYLVVILIYNSLECEHVLNMQCLVACNHQIITESTKCCCIIHAKCIAYYEY